MKHFEKLSNVEEASIDCKKYSQNNTTRAFYLKTRQYFVQNKIILPIAFVICC